MEKMSKEEQERVKESYRYGAKGFSKDDLDGVFEKEATAKKKSKHLGELAGDFKTLWAVLVDWRRGDYKCPWKMIAGIGFAIAYLIAPIDVVPDFIPGIGYIDDIGVFGFVTFGFAKEIEDYKQWKLSHAKTK